MLRGCGIEAEALKNWVLVTKPGSYEFQERIRLSYRHYSFSAYFAENHQPIIHAEKFFYCH
jgi:hypothetical protein